MRLHHPPCFSNGLLTEPQRESSPPVSETLKLIALDAEDLAVLSAHMQDAVLLVGDMAFLPRERRFAAIANRFDWEAATRAEARGEAGAQLRRLRAALRFERVLSAKVSGIDLKNKRHTLSILALQFTETNAPAGIVTIVCAGGGAIRLEVECLEAELKDLGAIWAAKAKPTHGETSARTTKPE